MGSCGSDGGEYGNDSKLDSGGSQDEREGLVGVANGIEIEQRWLNVYWSRREDNRRTIKMKGMIEIKCWAMWSLVELLRLEILTKGKFQWNER